LSAAADLPYVLRHVPGAPGSSAWWSEVSHSGTPLAEPLGDRTRLTFVFRASTATAAVLIDVSGVTDHHADVPSLMTCVDGTDIWWWQATVATTYRGQYRFVPAATVAELHPPGPGTTDRADAHRTWWISMIARSVADPLNPYATLRTSWDTPASPIHLPDAPEQPGWTSADRGASTHSAATVMWNSVRLRNRRRIWTHQVGTEHADQPLVLLLDGDTWAERMPIFDALDTASARGLPSCLCVLVDSIDLETRARELPCHEPFWHAIGDELLPLIAASHDFADDPARTVVAGQSYGGLAAVFAALRWPDRFGAAVAQSGSFWWPSLERPRPTSPVRIVQQVGRLENNTIRSSNASMHGMLVAAGHDVTYQEFEGGHELLCWRGGLIEALLLLLDR